jgi:tRNA(fMet)-specific endonuclease VapC
MRRYLLDTGVAGDYVYRRNQVFERCKAEVSIGNRIGICVPVLGELRFGVEFSQTRERNHQRLQLALPSLTI